MRKLVYLGYAQSNGKLDKEYQIIISNTDFRQCSQTPSQTPFQLRQTSSDLVNDSSLPSFDTALTTLDEEVTTPKPAPAEHLTTLTKNPNINIYVGDRVRYVGHQHWRICGDRVLTVKAILGDKAIVSYPSWLVDNTFPLQDLQKVS
jgi:hypothetical protein